MRILRSAHLWHYWWGQLSSGCHCCRWPVLGCHLPWGGLMKLPECGPECHFVGWSWLGQPVCVVFLIKKRNISTAVINITVRWLIIWLLNVVKSTTENDLIKRICGDVTGCVVTATVCVFCCCLCWPLSCFLCCVWFTDGFCIRTWTCFNWSWFFCWLCWSCPWACLIWVCCTSFCWLNFCWVSFCCANFCWAWSCFCCVCCMMSCWSCCCWFSRAWASFLDCCSFWGFGLPSADFCSCTLFWTCSRWICCSLSSVSCEHCVGWAGFFTWASSAIPSIPSSESTSFFTLTTMLLHRTGFWMVEALIRVWIWISGDVLFFSLPSFSNTTPPASLPCSNWDLRVSTSLCFCRSILVNSSICLSFSWSIWSLSMVSVVATSKGSGGWHEPGEGLVTVHELCISSLTCMRDCRSEATFDGCWGDGWRVSWVSGELTCKTQNKDRRLFNYLSLKQIQLLALHIDLTISPNISPLQLVSSGLIPAKDLSDGVGDTGGLELVLPNRMTRPWTTWVSDDNANLNPTSPNCWSEAAPVVGEAVTVLAAEVCWPGCEMPFFKAAPLLLCCSW